MWQSVVLLSVGCPLWPYLLLVEVGSPGNKDSLVRMRYLRKRYWWCNIKGVALHLRLSCHGKSPIFRRARIKATAQSSCFISRHSTVQHLASLLIVCVPSCNLWPWAMQLLGPHDRLAWVTEQASTSKQEQNKRNKREKASLSEILIKSVNKKKPQWNL